VSGGPGTQRPVPRYRRLLHAGSVVADLVLDVPALPERGGDVLARRSVLRPGGGFNVMAAAARQGLAVSYVGAHGTGPFGDLARAALAAEGIEVLAPPRPDADTGLVVVAVEPDGERTFLTSPGAEASLNAADLETARPTPADVVYLSGYGLAYPASRAALTGWLPRLPGAALVVFDPGPLAADIPRAALAAAAHRADWLTCNAREAALLAGQRDRDPGQAAAALSQRPFWEPRPGQRILVRDGPEGCIIGYFPTAPRVIPGFPVTAVDSNGAGDAHTGVFIAALARGMDAETAAREANAAAAIAVTRPGPATAPTANEVARFLSRQSWNSSSRN
jgi:sugar/nucleoside kinase (ribokinase family)